MAKTRVPAARAEASQSYLDELHAIEDEMQATAFALECREREDLAARQRQQRLDEQRVDDVTTEVLEAFASVGAGSLSAWKSGGLPIGSTLNYLLGTASKVGCFLVESDPQSVGERAVRIACRTGKTLLHAQLAISAKDVVLGRF